MRGADVTQESLFTVAKLADFVPASHPLRSIRALADEALGRMSGLFSTLYADTGRASIAPEKLMRAQLLQLFYSIRSERMLMEQLHYNLLFRWFVGVAIDEPVWDHSVFSKNRDRLNGSAVAAEFLAEVVRLADTRGLMSDEHFSVDGTLLQAWASHKSFRPKDAGPPDSPSGGPRNAQPDFKGQRRRNDTHASTSDPDSRLYRKGNTGAQLSYQAHVLMEHRSGLVRAACVTPASGHGERDAALAMLGSLGGRRRRTLAADKGYDTADFVASCRAAGVTPHVAQNTTHRRSARWPHHPARRLCDQPAHACMDRDALRLAQGRRGAASGQTTRPSEGRGTVPAWDGGEQSRPSAQVDRRGGRLMAARAGDVRPEVRNWPASRLEKRLIGG